MGLEIIVLLPIEDISLLDTVRAGDGLGSRHAVSIALPDKHDSESTPFVPLMS